MVRKISPLWRSSKWQAEQLHLCELSVLCGWGSFFTPFTDLRNARLDFAQARVENAVQHEAEKGEGETGDDQ